MQQFVRKIAALTIFPSFFLSFSGCAEEPERPVTPEQAASSKVTELTLIQDGEQLFVEWPIKDFVPTASDLQIILVFITQPDGPSMKRVFREGADTRTAKFGVRAGAEHHFYGNVWVDGVFDGRFVEFWFPYLSAKPGETVRIEISPQALENRDYPWRLASNQARISVAVCLYRPGRPYVINSDISTKLFMLPDTAPQLEPSDDE